MPFKDSNGNEYDASFWHMEDFHINTNRREMHVRFTGYSSIDAFENNQTSLANVGGTWSKSFTGEAYDRLIVLYAEAVAGVALATAAIAGSVKDTPNDGGDFESFFAEASEIISPPELQSLFKK